jgi:hypothetical protein
MFESISMTGVFYGSIIFAGYTLAGLISGIVNKSNGKFAVLFFGYSGAGLMLFLLVVTLFSWFYIGAGIVLAIIVIFPLLPGPSINDIHHYMKTHNQTGKASCFTCGSTHFGVTHGRNNSGIRTHFCHHCGTNLFNSHE